MTDKKKVRDFLDYVLRTGNESTDDLWHISLGVDATPIDEDLRQQIVYALTQVICSPENRLMLNINTNKPEPDIDR